MVRFNAMTTMTSRLKIAKVTPKKLRAVVTLMKPLCAGSIWEDRNIDFVAAVL